MYSFKIGKELLDKAKDYLCTSTFIRQAIIEKMNHTC